MKFKFKNNLIVWVFFMIPFIGCPQTDREVALTKKELRSERASFLNISWGFSYSDFRDFATSPQNYKGITGDFSFFRDFDAFIQNYKGITRYFSLSRSKSGQKREAEIGFSYVLGKYVNNFNHHYASSNVSALSLFYSQLYRVEKLSFNKFNVKVGGLFNTIGSLRINKSLQNNAYGIELFPTLFGSLKISGDVSRKKAKDKKFLFIKYKLKQKTRDISFRLNVGVVNSTFRNGYVYAGQSALLNSYDPFDEYRFEVFSGLRLSSALDFTRHLKNKNALQFSYLWDALRTGGDFDKFEMVYHTFKITLLFNTNNK